MDLKQKAVVLCSFVLAITASGCTSNQVTTLEAAIAEEAATREVDIAAATENTQASPIQVTNSGIGGLTASTPFDVDTIQTIFPELTVSTTTDFAEGVEYTVIVVSEGNAELMRIEPTGEQIYRVNVLAPQAIGPSGHSIGDAFDSIYSIYSGSASGRCGWVLDAQDNLAVCDAPSSQAVRYIFAGPWEDTVRHQTPTATELSSGVLQAMMWSTGNY